MVIGNEVLLVLTCMLVFCIVSLYFLVSILYTKAKVLISTLHLFVLFIFILPFVSLRFSLCRSASPSVILSTHDRTSPNPLFICEVAK